MVVQLDRQMCCRREEDKRGTKRGGINDMSSHHRQELGREGNV